MFRSCENKGFQIAFNNAYMISCQFSTFSYCSRRSFGGPFGEEKHMPLVESEDCEIAIFKNGDFVTGEILENMGLNLSGDGMISGYVSADDVGKIIAYLVGLEG